jgi:hypothetical protein
MAHTVGKYGIGTLGTGMDRGNGGGVPRFLGILALMRIKPTESHGDVPGLQHRMHITWGRPTYRLIGYYPDNIQLLSGMRVRLKHGHLWAQTIRVSDQ